MADVVFLFSMFWTGSNQQIASRVLWCYDPNNIDAEAFLLQNYAARLVGAKSSTCIKITLGSPGGPQLTRPLLLRPRPLTSIDLEAQHKAMAAAWARLHSNQVANVFVSQYSHAALAVHELCDTAWSYGFDAALKYGKLPIKLQRNASVALAALESQDKYVNMCIPLVALPCELQSNKKLALAAIDRVKQPHYVFISFNDALRNDEEVALALVAKNYELMLDLPLALRNSKEFVLKAVSINDKCIFYAAAHLQQDNDVKSAAAAARQCKALD